MSYVLVCDELRLDNFPPICAHQPYYAELQDSQAPLLSPLETGEAYQIAVAIAGLWTVAWVIKTLRKALEVRIGI